MPRACDAASVTRRWRRNASVVRRNFTVEMTFLGEFEVFFLPLKLLLLLLLVNVLETLFSYDSANETSEPSIFHVFVGCRCRSHFFSFTWQHTLGCLAPSCDFSVLDHMWANDACVWSRKTREKRKNWNDNNYENVVDDDWSWVRSLRAREIERICEFSSTTETFGWFKI